jgi:hypothetical protein
MKMLTLLFVIATYVSISAPVFISKGEIDTNHPIRIETGAIIEDLSFRHDINGKATQLSPEERKILYFPFSISYTFKSGEEISIISSYYSNISHKLSDGTNLSNSGFSDITILIRSMGKLWGEMQGPFGIGILIPIGDSIYKINNNQLPLGRGCWELILSFATVDKRDNLIFYGDISYYFSFPIKVNKVRGEDIQETKISSGHRLNWGVGMEYRVSNSISLLGECTGKISFEKSAIFESSGADATYTVNEKGKPEFVLQYMNEIYFTPIVQMKIHNNIILSAGYKIPIKIINNYSGSIYTFNSLIMF